MEVYLRCSLCKSQIPLDSAMCGLCGGVVDYDEEVGGYYISAWVCNGCGYQNEADTTHCKQCKMALVLTCPECKMRGSRGVDRCATCGATIVTRDALRVSGIRWGNEENRLGISSGQLVTGAMFLVAGAMLIWVATRGEMPEGRFLMITVVATMFCILGFAIVISWCIGSRRTRRGGRND